MIAAAAIFGVLLVVAVFVAVAFAVAWASARGEVASLRSQLDSTTRVLEVERVASGRDAAWLRGMVKSLTDRDNDNIDELRGLLERIVAPAPVPMDDVEPFLVDDDTDPMDAFIPQLVPTARNLPSDFDDPLDAV